MNKIGIAINGRFLTQLATGVQRYAYEIVRAWDVMLERGGIDSARYQIDIVAPRLNKPVSVFRCIPIHQVGFMSGNLWEQLELPWYTRRKLLLNLCNIGPILKLNQAVTIHDASVFAVSNSYTFLFRMKYQLVYLILSKTAKVVFTVSEFSKQELHKYCHIPGTRLYVIYEGCDHFERIIPDTSIFERKQIGDKPYIIAVGSNAIHKNLSILGEVSKLLDVDIDIIIAGEESLPWFTASPTDLAIGKIIQLGYVTDEELKALFQKAEVFVFPSLYEGFGLPPLEAMVCGCPVVCAKIPVLEEVCGFAAMYYENGDARELAGLISKLLRNEALKEEFRAKGKKQASKYSWEYSADSTWKILQSNIPL
jgi:glycosyltransferase involved in cell wall biosynthesis